jgi:hypothetical protein
MGTNERSRKDSGEHREVASFGQISIGSRVDVDTSNTVDLTRVLRDIESRLII